ncbi:hypothetical protein GCK72_012304 [Caenorhabditis remanei]|uniref:Tc1-like transposase DDE domain-containing protein n=1 Tax=Caenorhabditis remanei TaxID=31234 RepID=A0A6A5GMK3_CAERE|nr:hypothetical protein GCK72_012304 [Caenorhabditis remanei]KAF1755853.1 hypothetical protein GCK72_012304 [Caenorhabditis remanei]
MLPPFIKIKFSNLGPLSCSKLWPKERLSMEQIRLVETSPSAFLMIDNGTDISTQTDFCSINTSTQTETDPFKSFYEIMTQMKTVDVKNPSGNSQARLIQMIKNILIQVNNFKSQLGAFARLTVFRNVNKLVAALLGVAESTVIRYNKKTVADVKEKRVETRKMRNAKALELLSDDEKRLISEHIEKCYIEDSNFSVHSLHSDLQNLYDYPYSPSTLYRQLKAMRFSYKIKTYNPFSTVREEIVEWRARYLQTMEELRAQGAYICYYDETWLYHGMTKTRGWNRTDTSPYLIANLGDLSKPRPGFTASSDKGQRAIVLAVTTESEILPGSIDVVIPNRPKAEVLVDYHQYMSSDLYTQYMEKVLPLIVKATPAGRQAVLVIDNASIHNTLVETLPTKSSNKSELLAFLEKYQVDTAAGATNKELWEEVQIVMEARGGRDALKRYLTDEYAATLGVLIVRLPPYHCQFSPIELVWNQLKSHLRTAGKTSDKLEVVAERAKTWLRNTNEAQMAWTYEHVLDIEEGIKLVMDEDDESWEWDDDESDM